MISASICYYAILTALTNYTNRVTTSNFEATTVTGIMTSTKNMDQIVRDQATDLQVQPCSSKSTNPESIHSLPPELISEVFLCCLPIDELPRSSSQAAPTVLTHVCRWWRKIAIGNPSLWCRIQIGVQDLHNDSRAHAMSSSQPSFDARVLEYWMARSGSLPLSIHVGYPAESELSFESPLEIIMNLAPRWKDMAFSMPATYLQHVAALIPTGTPLLESFAMNDRSIPRKVTYKVIPPPKHPLSLDFASSPLSLLRYLSIGATIRFNFSAPLSALQTLSLDHCSPSNSLEILQNCPNIEDLTLTYYDLTPSEGLFQPESTILLSRVQKFKLFHKRYINYSLDIEDFLDIGELLDHLYLPSLTFFFYCDETYDDAGPEEWDYLSRLVYRSHCSIEELELETIRIDAESMARSLQLSPDLKHLGMTGAALGEALVNTLAKPLEHTITTYICPLLESFRLIDWIHSTTMGDTIYVLKIARSRLCLPIGQEGHITRFSFISYEFSDNTGGIDRDGGIPPSRGR